MDGTQTAEHSQFSYNLNSSILFLSSFRCFKSNPFPCLYNKMAWIIFFNMCMTTDGTFAETAIVNYRLSFAHQGTKISTFRLQQTN
jgi:hypothetical protein